MAEEKKTEAAELKFRQPVDHDFTVIANTIVTEESQRQSRDGNVVVVKVDPKSNKPEIKDAFQAIFQVKVDKVNTLNVHPKKRSARRGYTQAYKKAYIFVNKDYDLGKVADAVAPEERKAKKD